MNKNGELRSSLKRLLIQARTLSLSVIHSNTTFPAHVPILAKLISLSCMWKGLSAFISRGLSSKNVHSASHSFNTNSVGQAVLKVLLLCAIPPQYSLASWDPLCRHTEASMRSFPGQHRLAGCCLEFWTPPPQTLQLLFYTKLKGSWTHTMARLSLVTGFTPGEKNAVTSLGHPSVMAYNLRDCKFTENAFFLALSQKSFTQKN